MGLKMRRGFGEDKKTYTPLPPRLACNFACDFYNVVGVTGAYKSGSRAIACKRMQFCTRLHAFACEVSRGFIRQMGIGLRIFLVKRSFSV